MKIAIFTYIMDRHSMGTALHTREIVENLLKIKRPEDELYLVHRQKYDHPLYRHPDIKEVLMPRVRLPRLSNLISEALFLWKSRNDFDIIHYTQEAIYPLFWLSNAKIIISIHSAVEGWRDYGMKTRYWMVYWAFRFLHRWIAAIISVSETTKKSFQNFFHLPDDKFQVILEGVEERYYQRYDKKVAQDFIRNKYGIPAPYILNGSRLDPQKNIPRLIRAFAKLKSKYKVPHVLVAGSKHLSSENKVVEATIKELGLEKEVFFIPYVPEMPQMYAGADMFMFPSVHEGFGLPLLEAMAAGCPIVTANVFSLPEIAGNAALLVDPYNVDEMAEAMWQVLSDERLRQDLIKKGQERVRKFSWNKMTKEIYELYKKIPRT